MQGPQTIVFRGVFWVRDGLPLVSLQDAGDTVQGSVLYFQRENCKKAYKVIADFEPKSHYRWSVSKTLATGLKVNILVLDSPDKGNPVQFEGSSWSHLDDPVFCKGLLAVNEIADQFGNEPFGSSPPEHCD